VSETGPVVNIAAPEGQVLGNPMVALEFEPSLEQTVVEAVSAIGQVLPQVAAYQAQAQAFIGEYGAQVVGGHMPVGMSGDMAGGDASEHG
jgi:hypothetical protein